MPLQPMITGARHMISAGHYLATAGRPRHARGRGQCRRRRGRRRHRARCRAQRPGAVLGRGADDHLPRRARRGRGHQRPRRLAAGRAARDLRRRARRRDPARRPAHGGAGGAGRVDPRARALRHHELRRRGGRRHPLCARGLHHAPGDGPLHREERGDLSPLAGQCRHLPAPGTAAPRGRAVRAGGSRPLAAVHGGRGARGEPRRPDRRASRGARCLLSRRPGGGHGALPPRARRLAHRARPGGLPFRDRAARCRPASAASRCSPAARGARARSCSRCCRCSPPTISPRSATTRRPTSISSPRS